MKDDVLRSAGDLKDELADSTLDRIAGGSTDTIQRISKGNTGKHCTLTWECSICPTLTCFTC